MDLRNIQGPPDPRGDQMFKDWVDEHQGPKDEDRYELLRRVNALVTHIDSVFSFRYNTTNGIMDDLENLKQLSDDVVWYL